MNVKVYVSRHIFHAGSQVTFQLLSDEMQVYTVGLFTFTGSLETLY